MMPITTILFDLDDTLVVEEPSAVEAFLAAGELARRKYGVDPAALHESVRRCARDIWKAAPTHGYCRAIGISSWEGLWARFLGDHPSLQALRQWAPVYRLAAWTAALAEHDIDDVSLAEQLAEAFPAERRKRHVLMPGAEDVLKALYDRFTLGLITNGAADLQREKIEGSGLAGYFESITISGEIGAGKPDAEIFASALASLDADPATTVMIGNSLRSDVAAAQAIGMRAIWVNRAGADPPEDICPDAETADLLELPSLIEELQGSGRDRQTSP